MEGRRSQPLGYSTLEVDESANLPQVKPNNDLPEVKANGDLPEVKPVQEDPEVALYHGAGLPDGQYHQAREDNICGLRRKVFWLALIAAVLLFVIGIALGLGIGLTSKDGNSSSASDESASINGTSSSDSTITSRTGRVASFSGLSATNYTDAQDRKHSQVWFQDDSYRIWIADLDIDSTGSAWDVSEVNTTGTSPKRGTPIAGFTYFPDDSTSNSEFAIRYVDNTTSNIRARFVRNRHIGYDWEIAETPDNIRYKATNDSAIAGYGTACPPPTCVQANLLVFRNANDGESRVGYPYSTNWGFDTFPPEDGSLVPDNGTAYALVPILQLPNDSYPYVAMYLSAGNKLKEVYFSPESNDTMWSVSNMNVNFTMNSGSQIAAMSYLLDDLRYVQVLVTQESGGVMMAYLDGGPDRHWAETTSVSGMEDVIPLSPIAANQEGHVYALEDVDGRSEIVEFTRTSQTGTPTFERVGVVSPTPTET